MAVVHNIMNASFRVDLSGVEILDRSMLGVMSESISDTLDYLVDDYIPMHWSAVSPSSPGDFPAKVTGELEKSLKVIRRDNLGRFASAKNATSWAIQVQSEYGAALEFGVLERGLEPRPFLRPALLEAEKILGGKVQFRLNFVLNRINTVKKPFMAQRAYLANEVMGMG